MINVITGPPLSGKTNYINENKKDGDVVFCSSLIAKVFQLDEKENEIKKANRFILSLLANSFTENKNDKRLWVEFDKVPQWAKDVLDRYPHKIIKRTSSRALSLERAKTEADKERVELYFNSAESIHKFYLTDKWQRLRRFILKEHGYLCQNCKRYGRKTEATEVHHITPLREDFDKRLEINNLISLCSDCHKSMHLLDGSLSKEGKNLQRRTMLKSKFTNVNKTQGKRQVKLTKVK